MFVHDRKIIKSRDFKDENSCSNISFRSQKLFYIEAICITIGFISNNFFKFYNI